MLGDCGRLGEPGPAASNRTRAPAAGTYWREVVTPKRPATSRPNAGRRWTGLAAGAEESGGRGRWAVLRATPAPCDRRRAVSAHVFLLCDNERFRARGSWRGRPCSACAAGRCPAPHPPGAAPSAAGRAHEGRRGPRAHSGGRSRDRAPVRRHRGHPARVLGPAGRAAPSGQPGNPRAGHWRPRTQGAPSLLPEPPSLPQKQASR